MEKKVLNEIFLDQETKIPQLGGEVEVEKNDKLLFDNYVDFINFRRKKTDPAKIFRPEKAHSPEIAALIAAGGVVAIPWGSESRRIMILVCSYNDSSSTQILNNIKGRPARQVLGIGCSSELAYLVAELGDSRPLVNAARKKFNIDYPTDTHLIKVLELLYENNSVGLLLKAKDILPDEVTATSELGRTVLILGARDRKDENDIYNYVIEDLFLKYGKIVAGTSGNAHGRNVYSVASQQELYNELKFDVDGFVLFNNIPIKSPSPERTASSTTIDLTGEKPKVMRWGSQHPFRFKKVFSDLIIPNNVAREVHAEGTISYMINSLVYRAG